MMQVAMWLALVLGVIAGVYRALTVGREAARNARAREGRAMNFLALCVIVAAAIIYGRAQI